MALGTWHLALGTLYKYSPYLCNNIIINSCFFLVSLPYLCYYYTRPAHAICEHQQTSQQRILFLFQVPDRNHAIRILEKKQQPRLFKTHIVSINTNTLSATFPAQSPLHLQKAPNLSDVLTNQTSSELSCFFQRHSICLGLFCLGYESRQSAFP